MFRLPPEVFIRRMKTSHLHTVIGTVSSVCAKKTVVHMTELVAAVFTVHGSLSFLADVDRLLDPSGGSVWFPVDHRCVILVYVVCDWSGSGFAVCQLVLVDKHAPCGLRNIVDRISRPCFLAECRKRRLNRGSCVLLCFVLFAFPEFHLVSVMSVVCSFSSVLYFPA